MKSTQNAEKSSNMPNKTIVIVYNTTCYVYKFRVELINKLQEQGYQIFVISPYDEYVQKLVEYNLTHMPINMSQYSMNPFEGMVAIYQIYKALKRIDPMVSLNYTIKPNIYGNIAAWLSKTPVISNIAGAGKGFSNSDSWFELLIKILYKVGLRSAHTVFFQNNDDMRLFLDSKLVKKSQAIRIPGSGVNLEKYQTHKRLNSDKVNFLFLGRLLNEKGIGFYIAAAEKILSSNANVHFSIAGEHEVRKDYIPIDILDCFVKQENVTYYGGVSPDEIPRILDDSDCVVLPSYYREGVPRSLLEAAAMSKVIITTNSVGCKEVVENGVNGYKCPIKNVECLVESMQEIIDMPSCSRVKMGQVGRRKMELEFDQSIVLNQYLTQIGIISNGG